MGAALASAKEAVIKAEAAVEEVRAGGGVVMGIEESRQPHRAAIGLFGKGLRRQDGLVEDEPIGVRPVPNQPPPGNVPIVTGTTPGGDLDGTSPPR